MNKQKSEVMDILQEECAEVIQAVSKIKRFGLDTTRISDGVSNLSHLEVEIGDVMAMIEILIEFNVVDESTIRQAISAKKEKLKKWSNIYE